LPVGIVIGNVLPVLVRQQTKTSRMAGPYFVDGNDLFDLRGILGFVDDFLQIAGIGLCICRNGDE
jgi:hypothetical protein